LLGKRDCPSPWIYRPQWSRNYPLVVAQSCFPVFGPRGRVSRIIQTLFGGRLPSTVRKGEFYGNLSCSGVFLTHSHSTAELQLIVCKIPEKMGLLERSLGRGDFFLFAARGGNLPEKIGGDEKRSKSPFVFRFRAHFFFVSPSRRIMGIHPGTCLIFFFFFFVARSVTSLQKNFFFGRGAGQGKKIAETGSTTSFLPVARERFVFVRHFVC